MRWTLTDLHGRTTPIIMIRPPIRCQRWREGYEHGDDPGGITSPDDRDVKAIRKVNGDRQRRADAEQQGSQADPDGTDGHTMIQVRRVGQDATHRDASSQDRLLGGRGQQSNEPQPQPAPWPGRSRC